MSRPALVRALEHVRATAGPPAPLADDQLLTRFVTERDEAAFAELVRRHGPLVRGVARRQLADAHEADDVLQGTFLALARQAGRVGGRPLAPWLFTVAHRLARKARARAARRPGPTHNDIAVIADPLATLTARELVTALDDELARLPERYRLPVVLCGLDGLTRDEAAMRLRWSLGSLRGRLGRGRELLRTRLAKRGLTVPTVLAGGLLATPGESMPTALVRTVVRAAVAAPPVASSVKPVVVVALVLTALGVGTGIALVPGGQPPPKANPPAQAEGAAPPVPSIPSKQVDDPTWTVLDGVVIDETGKSMAGARVRFLGSYKASGPTTTDAAGRFRMTFYCGLGRFVGLVAESADGRWQGYLYLFPPEPTLHLTARIECRPPATIRMRAVDGQGRAVAGARTVIIVQGIMPLADAVTDAAGTTVFRIPANALSLEALAFRSGVGFDYAGDARSGGAKLPADVTLRLDGARTARVKVVDSAGRPIPGVSVQPSQVQKLGRETKAWLGRFIPGVEVHTDADGVAVFDWLPHDLLGMLKFTGFAEDRCWGSVTYDPHHDAEPLTMPMTRPVQVSGRITREGGRPAAGVLVRVCGRGPMEWAGLPPHMLPLRDAPYYEGDTRSGADGSYRLSLPPGQTFIITAIDADGAAPSHRQPTLDEAKEGAVLTGLDFPLGPGTIIRGRVMGGSPARPIAGHPVRLVEEGPLLPGPRAPLVRPTMMHRSTTDADGHFQFRAAAGTYQLWPSWEGRQPKIIRVANERTLTFDLVAELPVILAGRVRDDQGRPVANAKVFATEAMGQKADAQSDQQGRFRLERQREPVMLFVTDGPAKSVSLAPVGEADESIEITLRPAAKVTGRLVSPEGTPLAGVVLTLYVQCKLPPLTMYQSLKKVATGADGRFSVGGLPGGFTHSLRPEAKEGRRQSTLKRFEIGVGETIDLGDLTISPEK